MNARSPVKTLLVLVVVLSVAATLGAVVANLAPTPQRGSVEPRCGARAHCAPRRGARPVPPGSGVAGRRGRDRRIREPVRDRRGAHVPGRSGVLGPVADAPSMPELRLLPRLVPVSRGQPSPHPLAVPPAGRRRRRGRGFPAQGSTPPLLHDALATPRPARRRAPAPRGPAPRCIPSVVFRAVIGEIREVRRTTPS